MHLIHSQATFLREMMNAASECLMIFVSLFVFNIIETYYKIEKMLSFYCCNSNETSN